MICSTMFCCDCGEKIDRTGPVQKFCLSCRHERKKYACRLYCSKPSSKAKKKAYRESLKYKKWSQEYQRDYRNDQKNKDYQKEYQLIYRAKRKNSSDAK